MMMQNKICHFNVGGLLLLIIMHNNLKSRYIPVVRNPVLKLMSMFVLKQAGATHGCLIIADVVCVCV